MSLWITPHTGKCLNIKCPNSQDPDELQEDLESDEHFSSIQHQYTDVNVEAILGDEGKNLKIIVSVTGETVAMSDREAARLNVPVLSKEAQAAVDAAAGAVKVFLADRGLEYTEDSGHFLTSVS